MQRVINNGKQVFFNLRTKLAMAGIALVLCVVAYHAIFGPNGLLVYQQKRRESAELDRQIKLLQQQNANLEQENKALKTDPKAIEKEARERLRYVRPGEFVYTVPTTPAAQPAQKK